MDTEWYSGYVVSSSPPNAGFAFATVPSEITYTIIVNPGARVLEGVSPVNRAPDDRHVYPAPPRTPLYGSFESTGDGGRIFRFTLFEHYAVQDCGTSSRGNK